MEFILKKKSNKLIKSINSLELLKLNLIIIIKKIYVQFFLRN